MVWWWDDLNAHTSPLFYLSVDFITCGLKSKVRYESKDSHFEVQADGSIVVKEHLKLHGHKEFGVVALEGKNVLTETTVILRKRHPHHKQVSLLYTGQVGQAV